MEEYSFPWPDHEKGYSLFPSEMEDDPLVLFHGTAIGRFDPIISEGFKSGKELGGGTDPSYHLESVSYANSSSHSLMHVCNTRDRNGGGVFVVFVVKFPSLPSAGITVNQSDIHVFDPRIEPTILGFCVVPESYRFV